MAKPTDASFVVKLNVGGVNYCTTAATLRKDSGSLLAAVANGTAADTEPGVLSAGDDVTFIDRDGELFRYVLDFLRVDRLILPAQFAHGARLKEEAKFYRLTSLQKAIKTDPQCRSPFTRRNGGNADSTSSSSAGTNSTTAASDFAGGYITIGYRGTFAFGRDGQADVKFRKLNRILVCGKAFDELAEKGFRMTASCASGANGLSGYGSGTGLPLIPSSGGGGGGGAPGEGIPRSNADWEEQRWGHYTEFVFCKEMVPNGKSC